ncbi:NucA/NucB deoxyribonuclease domain-containing protein [Clostridium sp.]|uniref:NucA/NucB deoxyribonuclease domain-containing protein n=1 Tax=Clostridium sp. TaxID=1506 RepID=UPI002621FA3A|nr:NucA/NucB deoxyribonuclease domain-containing protein [Clostridium sp.]
MAISDIRRGEVSDITDYMWAGGREAFIGALSGAIFGPFGAGEALAGKMALGAATNAFESIVRQKLNGEDINWGTVLFDGGIGALTAGMFHGGGKLIEAASPFVKKAFNKVSSVLSENAKYAKTALENMQKGPKSVVLGSNLGNVDEALGRLDKEFKNAKNQIADGGSNADVVEVEISRSKYPESAKHIEDAIANGQPDVLTINRSGSKLNRKASLKGIDKVPGKDLDEYPPAMFEEGGDGASVRPINPSDNRGSGSTAGHQLRPYPNGTKVKYKITDDDD